MSAYGSALVALDDPRALLATTLVLQEMGRTVDLVEDLPQALEWVEAASYELVVCAGRVPAVTAEFARHVRYLSSGTRLLVLAEPAFSERTLEGLGAEVLRAPVDVNRLVARLWPRTPQSPHECGI